MKKRFDPQTQAIQKLSGQQLGCNEHDDKNVLIVVTGQNAYLFIGSITLYDEQ